MEALGHFGQSLRERNLPDGKTCGHAGLKAMSRYFFNEACEPIHHELHEFRYGLVGDGRLHSLNGARSARILDFSEYGGRMLDGVSALNQTFGPPGLQVFALSGSAR